LALAGIDLAFAPPAASKIWRRLRMSPPRVSASRARFSETSLLLRGTQLLLDGAHAFAPVGGFAQRRDSSSRALPLYGRARRAARGRRRSVASSLRD